jgi:adenine-specific DNA-methyltransferase
MIPASYRLRKRLGAFYTPKCVADPIVEWAIRRPTDTVMDPSYGGCVFLETAIERLKRLASPNPKAQLFGTDIDPKATSFLPASSHTGGATDHFPTADFLAVKPSDFPAPFDCIVGNPPYVRHHQLSSASVAAARRATPECELPATASYWAYFIVHSLKFLRRGGRLGLVLPGSFLSANYAIHVRNHILASFASARVVLIRAPIFSDAEERGVVLLADDHGRSTSSFHYSVADSIGSLRSKCFSRTVRPLNSGSAAESHCWPLSFLTARERNLFSAVSRRRDVVTLGSVAKIRIGVVTGANEYFILSLSNARRNNLTRLSLVPILSSGRQIRSLSVGKRDIDTLLAADVPALLLDLRPNTRSEAAHRYMASICASKVKRRFKCSNREHWFAVGDTLASDAFLTYVNHFSPRLVLNSAHATSTNAIHRLWWKRRRSLGWRQLASLASLTSLFGISAELAGRSVGGGALKVEIGDASQLLIVDSGSIPFGLPKYFIAANAALLASEWERARDLADDFVLGHMLQLTTGQRDTLRTAHNRLLEVRMATAGSIPRRTLNRRSKRATAPRSSD